MNELIRVELISRLRFGLLPSLATRCKQNIYFALFVFTLSIRYSDDLVNYHTWD